MGDGQPVSGCLEKALNLRIWCVVYYVLLDWLIVGTGYRMTGLQDDRICDINAHKRRELAGGREEFRCKQRCPEILQLNLAIATTSDVTDFRNVRQRRGKLDI